MLTHLSIKNLAVVAEMSLEIPDQMTVITGETGVGKSLMVDGLALLLGQRADASMIGQGGDSAEISGVFAIQGLQAVLAWLETKSLAAPDLELIIRRVIRTDGPSRAFVNGSPVTLSELKILGQYLADIHAQHEHQALLSQDTQRTLLDDFGGASKLRREVRSHYDAWDQLKQKQASLIAGQKARDDRIDYLSYQLKELQDLALEDSEVSALDQELRQLSQIEDSLRWIHEAEQGLSDTEGAGMTSLQNASRALAQVTDSRLDEAKQILTQSIIQLEELHRDLAHFLTNNHSNPERLRWIESRLQDIQDVARKHRCEPEMLIAFEVQVTQELAELNESDASVASLDQAIDKAETQWRSSARALSKIRSSAAVKLEKAVKKLLNQMNMTDAELTVALSPLNDVSPFGLEDTRFLISTNPGQSPQALQKTASGGELSRISLAIQVATLGRHAVPTVVFDEVDVGIGGSVAQTIGELLRTLGAHTQVLVVTHLGQVAAQGHHHFNVDKQAGVSSIKRLKPEGSVEEVARMLSGTQVTPQSLAHAQEMVNQARKA